MKKFVCLTLCLLMIMGSLAACGDKPGGENSNVNENGQVVLTIGLPLNAGVEDYNTNAYTLWLEEQTGYDLQFMLFQGSGTDYGSQLSTMMLDDSDLPDILWRMSLNTEVYQEYGEDQYFIDMTELLNDKEKSAIWWEQVGKLDEDYQARIMKELKAESGGIYAFPRVEYSQYDVIKYQAMINQEWLDALELEMPRNAEDLYNVLIAFRDDDPNGNGKADEIPLIYSGTDGYGNGMEWLLNMFTYVDENNWFNVDDNGKLYLPHTTQYYRDALIYIHKLVKEGLLPDSAWSMNTTDLKGLVNPGDGIETVGVFLGHPTAVFANNTEGIYAYTAMPFWGNAVLNQQALSFNTYITEDCENVDAAWKLLMTMCSEEGSRRMRYGELGKDWDYADAGTTTMLGTPAQIKVIDEKAFAGQTNQTWKAIGATVLLDAENETTQLSEDMSQWHQYKLKLQGAIYSNFMKANAENNPEEKFICPKLYYTIAQTEEISAARSNTQTYIKSARASFCTGSGELNDPSDDAQWAKYLQELEKNGMGDWLEMAQQIYDAQKAG